MLKEIYELWPELEWIEDESLREKTACTWSLALERSDLSLSDLHSMPFTLLAGPEMKIDFMSHKRSVVHISKVSAEKIREFYGKDLPVNMDVLIAGAILADVGKLLEYEKDETGKMVQGRQGQYLRHPFSGVALARECAVPGEVCHIIAAHASEGDLVKRTTEAMIVHHADFMTFLAIKERYHK